MLFFIRAVDQKYQNRKNLTVRCITHWMKDLLKAEACWQSSAWPKSLAIHKHLWHPNWVKVKVRNQHLAIKELTLYSILVTRDNFVDLVWKPLPVRSSLPLFILPPACQSRHLPMFLKHFNLRLKPKFWTYLILNIPMTTITNDFSPTVLLAWPLPRVWPWCQTDQKSLSCRLDLI